MPGTAALLQPFLARPDRSAVLTDFDGTLSPIVEDPAAARPLPGTVTVLGVLAARYARAAVISGRPVSYLLDRIGPGPFAAGLVASGVYGLEVVDGGERRDHPDAERWRPVVAAAVERASVDGPTGVLVEPKGLSLTLHYRTAPGLESDVRAWAAAEAATSGLVVHGAKRSVELHPPIEADKGTAVRALAAGLEAVVFLGDDVGDLPAFAALDALRGEGVHTVKVAVDGAEASEEMLAGADIVVEGPDGALAVLRRLAG